MTYSNYNTSDFLLDDNFVQWVREPDAQSTVFWQDIIAKNPDKKKEIERAIDTIRAAQEVPYPSLEADRKAAMWAHIQAQKDTPDLEVAYVNPNRPLWKRLAMAATFLLFAVGIWFFMQKNTPSVSDPILASKKVQTVFQQRKQVTLPDGSLVTLNADSKLRIAENWGDASTREVWLEGEAFFEVTKKPNTGAAKFIVHTNQLDVEVLGTAFNVKARRGSTEVVLQSGKVNLKKLDKTIIEMKPNERVQIIDNQLINAAEIVPQKVETEKFTAWTNGKIIFDNTPLSDIVNAIEDHFGYKVNVVNKELLETRYTGELLTDMPDVFFKILATTLEIDVQLEGKNMIIKKK
jgi:transmembrane sensor